MSKDTVLIVGGNSQDARYLQRLYQGNLDTSEDLILPKAVPIMINTNRSRLDINLVKAATKYFPKVMYYFHAVSNPAEAAADPVYAHRVNYEDFVEACKAYWRIVPDGTVFYAGSILQFRKDDHGRSICSLGDNNTVDFASRNPYVYSRNKAYAYLMEMKDRGHKVKYGFLSRHDSKYRNSFMVYEICKAAVESRISGLPSYLSLDAAFEKNNRGFAGDYAEMIFQFAHRDIGGHEAIFAVPQSFYSLHDVINIVESALPGSRINFDSKSSNNLVMDVYLQGVFAPIDPIPEVDFVYTSYEDTVKEILRTVYLKHAKDEFCNQNTCHM